MNDTFIPPLFHSLWQSLPMPAVIIKRNAEIGAANSMAEAFFNLSERSLIGQNLDPILGISQPLERVLSCVRTTQAPFVINETDVEVISKTTNNPSGFSRQCTLQFAPLQDNSMAILLLISPREIADRLGHSVRMKSVAYSAIGMAEMLTHEIKNPLAGISGAAQLLAMGLQKKDQKLTDLIVLETQRIVKLLEQVEQFGSQLPPNRQIVNLHDALQRARSSALVSFAVEMDIIEEYDPSLPPTYADLDQLTQVFLNLIKNATQACQGKGYIRLRSYFEATRRLHPPTLVKERNVEPSVSAAVPLTIEVIDNGPGIPADIASRIFEPFVSGHANGKGLGLALVSKIITDHEGWIEVDNTPRQTIFRISLPVARLGKKEQG